MRYAPSGGKMTSRIIAPPTKPINPKFVITVILPTIIAHGKDQNKNATPAINLASSKSFGSISSLLLITRGPSMHLFQIAVINILEIFHILSEYVSF